MYMIVRHYRSDAGRKTIIKTCLTLEEAQAHCNDPKTRKEGVWFDGYADQRYCIRNANHRRVLSYLLFEEAEKRAKQLRERKPNNCYTVYPMESFK